MIRDDREPWRLAWQTYRDDVRSAVRIEDIVARDAGAGKPSGSRIRFSSPFRSEKTPSFDVHPEQGSWYDYGDATGGDVFSYLMRKRGCNFREAIDSLAADYSVVFRPPDASPDEIKAYLDKIHEKKLVRDLQFVIVSWMHEQLTPAMRGWMLEKYGLTSETLNDLKIGFGGPTCYEELSEFRSDAELLSTGFFHRTSEGKIFGEFDSRMVFPYWVDGHVVYAAARYYEPSDPTPDWSKKRKYLKLLVHKPDNPYVSEVVSNEWFFNEDVLREKPSYIIITEGYTDCALLKQSGVPSLSPVTKQFRESDYERLAKLLRGVGIVYVINDTDVVEQTTSAGEKRTIQPGKQGALAIARRLIPLGVNVRIGTIPELKGFAKVDLNDFLRVLLPEDRLLALRPLLDGALGLPDLLLRDLPLDTKPEDISAGLKEWADVVSSVSDPIARDAFIRSVSKKFPGTKRRSVEQLLRPLVQTVERTKKEDVRKREKEERQKANESRKGIRFRGAIKEDTSDLDASYFIEMEMGNEYISNFTLTPKGELVDEEGETTVVCDVSLRGGRTHRDAHFRRSAWVGKKAFISAFPVTNMNWTGSDDNVQALLGHLTSVPLNRTLGTTVLGYHEVGNKPEDRRFILPGVTLTKEGPMEVPDASYLSHLKSSLAMRITSKPGLTGDELKNTLKTVLDLAYGLNHCNVIDPAMAWFWACPFRPRLQKTLNHFPILNIWGTQSAGKSSTGRLLWRLAGVTSALGKYNAADTKFAIVHIMSSSNCVPVFFDEFKHDMGVKEKEMFTRFLRLAYDGDAPERGNADKSTSKYKLSAPILVCGESKFEDDSALAERMISINPSSDDLNEIRRHNYNELHLNPNLEQLGVAYAQWTLGVDINEIVDRAQAFLQEALGNKIKKGRIFDNLVVLTTGALAIRAWAEGLGLTAPAVNVEALLSSLPGALHSDHVAIDEFDRILSDFALMAATGHLRHETHYLMVPSNKIRIAIHLCLAEHESWCKSKDRTSTKIGKAALHNLIKEKARRHGSYITDFSDGEHQCRANMIFSKPHCVEIDPSLVPSHFRIDTNAFHANAFHANEVTTRHNRDFSKPGDKPSLPTSRMAEGRGPGTDTT